MYVAFGPDRGQGPRLWGLQPGAAATHTENVVGSGLVAVGAGAVYDCVSCVCSSRKRYVLVSGPDVRAVDSLPPNLFPNLCFFSACSWYNFEEETG